VLEQSLIALRQQEEGTMTVRSIEEFLLLEPRTGESPLDAQRLAASSECRTLIAMGGRAVVVLGTRGRGCPPERARCVSSGG
jgi:hypothetical protein